MNEVCIRGHEMHVSSNFDAYGSHRYTCDSCIINNDWSAKPGERWFCTLCLKGFGWNYCFICISKQGIYLINCTFLDI